MNFNRSMKSIAFVCSTIFVSSCSTSVGIVDTNDTLVKLLPISDAITFLNETVDTYIVGDGNLGWGNQYCQFDETGVEVNFVDRHRKTLKKHRPYDKFEYQIWIQEKSQKASKGYYPTDQKIILSKKSSFFVQSHEAYCIVLPGDHFLKQKIDNEDELTQNIITAIETLGVENGFS